MPTSANALSFGDFHADLVNWELFQNGSKVPLQEKPFRVLAFLLHNPGRVVSREELIQEFWPGPFAAEDGLNTAVRKIRQALQDDAKRPKYIETVGQRGYRFIAKIQESLPESSSPNPAWIGLMLFNQIPESAPNSSFADGLAEEIVSHLGRLRPHALAVTLLRYKDSAAAEPTCRRLGVYWIVTGIVRTQGNRVRLTVKLQRVGRVDIQWAETFESDLDDVFRTQDCFASAVAKGLTGALGIGRPVVQSDSAARRLYLKGRFFWNKRTAASLRKAAEAFQKSIEVDPSFAPAYAGLADTAIMRAKHGFVFPNDSYAAAKQMALKALELDNSLAEAYVSLAWTDLVCDRNWEGAERQFNRAIELNPNYSFAYSGYAYLLTAAARFDEAESLFKKALEFDPLSLPINAFFGLMLYYKGDYQGAIRQLQDTLDLDPHFQLARIFQAQAYAAAGQWEPAVMQARAAVVEDAESPVALGMIGYIYARAGLTAEAQDILRQLESMHKQIWVYPWALALVHMGLGSHEAAMDHLESGERTASQWILLSAVNPKFAPLHRYSRFRALLDKLKLKLKE
jgi:DNA-binding winged helix-turn-helix (wHTH) protein/Flp pilus assembly protein TadD